MPWAPKTLRPRPNALQLAAKAEANKAYEERRKLLPWRSWYGTARWQSIRALQLQDEPLCRRCQVAERVVPATVCDHITPHKGDLALFWHGPFQSLCGACHNIHKQREERS